MTTVATARPVLERARHLRGLLATRGPLSAAPIGTVPILWNNVDVADLRLGTDAEASLPKALFEQRWPSRRPVSTRRQVGAKPSWSRRKARTKASSRQAS